MSHSSHLLTWRCILRAVYIFILLLYLCSSPPFVSLCTLVCAFAHEGSHLLCARLCGRSIRPLSFCPAGIRPEVSEGGELSGILIYAAGPLANLTICIICLLCLKYNYTQSLYTAFCVNLALALYNLTPVPFSDGSGIMRAALCYFLGARVGTFLCSALELLFSFIFFILFSFCFFASGRGLFSFFSSFVFVIISIENLTENKRD